MIFNKIFYSISMLGILLGIGMALWFMVTLFYPFDIVDIKNQPYKVLTPVVVPGGLLQIETNFCKLKDAPGKVKRYLRGPITVYLPEIPTDLPVGCYKNTSYVLIPTETISGTYHLFNAVDYEIYPWRRIRETSYTEDFFVTP